MNIIVNAQQCDITSTTIAKALNELGYNSPALATALNGHFVAREDRCNTALKSGDQLEVLSPMQGG